MRISRWTSVNVCDREGTSRNSRRSSVAFRIASGALLPILALCGPVVRAQVNVLTAHNDISRTGQNTKETLLTPANVNTTQFGKLFSQPIHDGAYAQPLYVSQVAVPGKGTHNVVYIATTGDVVYAFDADNNGGINATALWQVSLLTNTSPAGTYTAEYGVYSTPVIDLTTNTLYAISSENLVSSGTDVFRLHALDITTGAEKFGGPVLIQGSVSGTGSASSGGTLTFDPAVQRQRPALLLLNGVVYAGFGSDNDNGPWHGWLFSYSASTLQQLDVFCLSANGSGAGIWMGGAGLAAEVNNPAQPYGRMFFAVGNGSFTATKPYTTTMSYGMSVLDLDLTGGVFTVKDLFSPWNEAKLDSQDGDLGSGGLVLLPPQTLASGSTLNPLVQEGKSGMIYILDRNNLGGFNAVSDQIVQEVQTPESGANDWGAGIWGSIAYWNNNIFVGGANQGSSNPVAAYSFVNGVLSTTPTSQTSAEFPYPAPTPSISSNGTTNGIVWVLNTSAYQGLGSDVLLAFDATNLENLLYSSNTNVSRDNPGDAVKFTVPTIANGKVYVGAAFQMSVFGLLGVTPTVAPPVFNPPSGSFTGSQSVSISDATSGAQIFYTTDGSTPTVNSALYKGPITVTASETVTAIASATGYLQGAAVAATYSSTANAANPVFSLAGGSYNGSQTLTITDSSPGAVIYYTVDGTTPTTTSARYTKAITVPVSETVTAFATAPGLLPSATASVTFDIDPVYTFDFSQGFAQAVGPIQFNGSTDLDDFRMQLTNGGTDEAGSAFYTTPVDVASFTTDFTFQLSNPTADGMTFTLQNDGPSALGGYGGDLGYYGIPKSVAVKFDLYNDNGEGPNSTGLYINGAKPTVPAINLTGTGIDLHSGDYMNAHITYDGTDLNLTLTDALSLATWSQSFPVNIPAHLGAQTGYVGFTGGTGGGTSSQKITSWTYLAGKPPVPSFPAGFDTINVAFNGGAALSGTALQVTNGGAGPQTVSAYYAKPVDIESFTTDFDFQMTKATADGFTFVIQNAGDHAIGGGGAGLGYEGIPESVAIKFDIFNNAGEGTDSTGVYVNGAAPTVPSIDLTSSKLSLSGGDLIHAHIVYNGTTLTWTLTDETYYLHFSETNSVTLNIPHTVGGNTAYIGFTGSSGTDGSAVQNILDWTFSNP